jgi:hypothetical protein
VARRKFGPFKKQPNEKFPISIDFADDLQSSETISSAEVIAYDRDETDVSSTILSGVASIVDGEDQDGTTHANAKVVHAGTNNMRYKVTFRATTSDGNVYEADVFFIVKEI